MIFIRNFQYCLFHVCYITTSMSATLPLPCLLHYLFHVMEEALFDLRTVAASTVANAQSMLVFNHTRSLQ